ncbi:hypothetical protein NMG60_11007601 [Bertholletia excelsa]
MGDRHRQVLLLSCLLLISQTNPSRGSLMLINFLSWDWFSPSPGEKSSGKEVISSEDTIAEFSMETSSSSKGIEIVENARKKMATSKISWCSEILADGEKKKRLAWHLSDCFQKDSGRHSFPFCDAKFNMGKCLAMLDNDSHKVYLEFYLHANIFCHQLQADAFKRQTERLVNELKDSARFAESKLEIIEEKAGDLSRNLNNIQDSVASLEFHTQQVANISENVGDLEIVINQLELHEGQEQMKNKLQESKAMLQDHYNSMFLEISRLQDEAVEIQRKIYEVGDAMTWQAVALDGLHSLTQFQSQALEESRQDLLQHAHDRLIENSRTILAAQEAFESKQASMFVALDKLFTLHNAMLLESRVIKAFIIYSILIFIVYVFTSTKQTYAVRPRLYIVLCATFLIECAILRHGTNNIEQQTWMISIIRSLFALVASIQLLYSIYTFRDYEMLNHHDVEWSTWIDSELPEDLDNLEDPDYILPEEIGENSIMTTSTTTKNDNEVTSKYSIIKFLWQ